MAKSLDNEVRVAVHYIRERLGQANIGNFEFRICAEGRTSTDVNNVKIEYVVTAGWDVTVKGAKVEAVVTEVLRRKGWDEANAPLSLTHDTTC